MRSGLTLQMFGLVLETILITRTIHFPRKRRATHHERSEVLLDKKKQTIHTGVSINSRQKKRHVILQAMLVGLRGDVVNHPGAVVDVEVGGLGSRPQLAIDFNRRSLNQKVGALPEAR